jgi:ATP-dependent RNA helicase DeaD
MNQENLEATPVASQETETNHSLQTTGETSPIATEHVLSEEKPFLEEVHPALSLEREITEPEIQEPIDTGSIYDEYESEIENIVEPENPLPEITLEELSPVIQAALIANGWNKLMPVQSRTVPYMLSGRDMLIQSKTGSGKTGAFLIPLVSIMEEEHAHPQALILVPTRELAVQVMDEFTKLSNGRKLRAVALFGGVKYEAQIEALRKGVHLVVATPGRLLDLLEQRILDFDSLRDLVMDEADEMLGLGFYPDMKAIQRYLPDNYCTTMFSATVPPAVKSLSREFQASTRGFLSLSSKNMSTDALEHIYHVVEAMDKDRSILRLLEFHHPESAIIFCNMKRDVHYLCEFLTQHGFDVGELSGDVNQAQRTKTLRAFRDQSLKILIATDVAARGIDISHVTHVFLHDHPEDNEVYVHRAGRTARAGKTGKAISVVTAVEEISLKKTKTLFGFNFKKEEMPSESEVRNKVCQRLIVHLEQRLHDLKPVQERRVRQYVPMAQDLVQMGARPEILALLLEDYVRHHAGKF